MQHTKQQNNQMQHINQKKKPNTTHKPTTRNTLTDTQPNATH
jgi:hypothetical protein